MRGRQHIFIRLAILFTLICGGACASHDEETDEASAFIAAMDAKTPEERVPDWDETRALMSRPAPRVGDPAPDFELEREDGGGMIRLSDLWPERPVVLVFGSYT